MPVFTRTELAPIVAQVLERRDVEVQEWRVTPLGGERLASLEAGGRGVFRLTGLATDRRQPEEVQAWSAVVKLFAGSGFVDGVFYKADTMADPALNNYWQREILAYRSGLLADLPGPLVAPRCYGVVEQPGDEWRVWLEDIEETRTRWTLARHALAAHHLGEFNGAYLPGHANSRPLPADAPWLYRGCARDWGTQGAQLLDQFQYGALPRQLRRFLTEASYAQICKILANREHLLAQLDRLPHCLCHHDAFRRNLLARDGATGAQTVAIDWSMCGLGAVGEEIGITTQVNLTWLEMGDMPPAEVDGAIFGGYLDGLRAAGWQGDPRLVRLGYTATVALVLAGNTVMGAVAGIWEDANIPYVEAIMGHPIDAIVDNAACVAPFLFDMGDEALALSEP